MIVNQSGDDVFEFIDGVILVSGMLRADFLGLVEVFIEDAFFFLLALEVFIPHLFGVGFEGSGSVLV